MDRSRDCRRIRLIRFMSLEKWSLWLRYSIEELNSHCVKLYIYVSRSNVTWNEKHLCLLISDKYALSVMHSQILRICQLLIIVFVNECKWKMNFYLTSIRKIFFARGMFVMYERYLILIGKIVFNFFDWKEGLNGLSEISYLVQKL